MKELYRHPVVHNLCSQCNGPITFGLLSLIFFFLFSIGPCSLAAQHPLDITSLTLTDPDRNNRHIPVIVYYPATQAGEQTVPVSGSYPLFVIGHEFAMGAGSYTSLSAGLVAEGFVVALTNTETSILPPPDHLEFGKDIIFTANTLRSMSAENPSFFLYGSIW